jgi:primosomal protein N' (replication factor Y) (superfamily II helicase)
MHYAEVTINVPVNQTYHYHIPDNLDQQIQVGSLVRVQFGVAMQPAVVVAVHDTTDIPETKPIRELLDPLPVMSMEHIELARWLSDTFMESMGQCIWKMLPPGLIGKANQQITLVDKDAQPRGSLQSAIVDFLRESDNSVRMTKLRTKFKGKNLSAPLAKLEEAGVIERQYFLMPPSIKRKSEQVAQLTFPGQQIANIARHVGKAVKKADLLEVIATHREDPIGVQDALHLADVKSKSSLRPLIDAGLIFIEPTKRGEQDLIFLDATPEMVEETLHEWRGSAPYLRILNFIIETNHAPTIKQIIEATQLKRSHVKKLINDGLIEMHEEKIWRNSLADRDFVPAIPPILTPDQQAIWEVVNDGIQAQQWDNPQESKFLLHGVTGSGKTEIYLRAIEQTLAQGRQAFFLVPEIALTSQTIRRVAERFPEQVAIYHGSLSREERYDTWRRAQTGEITIIVGTRSAIFIPFPDVGLIILDEEHDPSYKQTPPEHEVFIDNNLAMLPYHTRDVAEQLVEHNKGVLILGSATPDIVTYHRAKQGYYKYLHMPNRIMGHRQRIIEQAERAGVVSRYQADTEDALHIDLPPVSVVDMTTELRTGNTSMFSRELQKDLSDVLERGEQAMLLLNRRGQSTYVFCRDCGYVVQCTRCDTSLTYHRYGEAMRCHHCGANQAIPHTCPACQSTRIKFFGAGTQHVEEALKQMFPEARTLRWDADTADKPELHHDILQQFIDRKADIVIGTQMIAKGLDLPLVTLVGVVSADLGLALPDYRAGERVFQLLTQVAGRAGRGILGGKVVLQTYQPKHYVIQAASKHDYLGFVEKEIASRREIGYPPFRRFARVLFRYTDFYKTQKEAEEGARRVRALLEEHELSGTEMIGPAPCFFTRIDRHYRWHLLLRGPNPAVALRDLKLERGWQIDIDPVDVL